jgi:hypothetical protein
VLFGEAAIALVGCRSSIDGLGGGIRRKRRRKIKSKSTKRISQRRNRLVVEGIEDGH